jgi:hypothetical protein
VTDQILNHRDRSLYILTHRLEITTLSYGHIVELIKEDNSIETGYWPCDEEFSALEGLLFSQMGHLVDYWQEHHPDEVIKSDPH